VKHCELAIATTMVNQMSFYPNAGRPDLIRESALSELGQDDPHSELVAVDDGWPLAPICDQRLAPCDRVDPANG
jgi:hypothetical protein